VQTIKEGREFLRRKRHEGATCPCCEQHVQVYRRSINAGMAFALILLSRKPSSDSGWIDIRAVDGLRGGDYAKLRHWGLLEQRPNTDPKKKWSGLWRLTQLGRQFVHDQARVQRYAHVYNGRVLTFSGEDVSIRRCLGRKFDYEELVSGS
jgi:hypothetical protein